MIFKIPLLLLLGQNPKCKVARIVAYFYHVYIAMRQNAEKYRPFPVGDLILAPIDMNAIAEFYSPINSLVIHFACFFQFLVMYVIQRIKYKNGKELKVFNVISKL